MVVVRGEVRPLLTVVLGVGATCVVSVIISPSLARCCLTSSISRCRRLHRARSSVASAATMAVSSNSYCRSARVFTASSPLFSLSTSLCSLFVSLLSTSAACCCSFSSNVSFDARSASLDDNNCFVFCNSYEQRR